MPKKDAALIRVPFNCLIAPVTKEAITDIRKVTKEAEGRVVDRAIALLAFGEEITAQKGVIKTVDRVESDIRADEPVEIVRETVVRASRPLKRPGVPEWKRGPRQKGDKTR